MDSPEVIVFDLGKVLLDFDYVIAARRIAAGCSGQIDPAKFFSEHAALVLKYEHGAISTAEFSAEACALCGFGGTNEEFGELFGDIFAPIEPMLELHAAVRRKRVPAYIFSNTNELAIRHIRRQFPFFSDFDGYVLSYEHGVMKPDAKLYEVVEGMAKRRGHEILYIDDRPENIAAGAARGWRTILHESPTKTCAAFEDFGVLD